MITTLRVRSLSEIAINLFNTDYNKLNELDKYTVFKIYHKQF